MYKYCLAAGAPAMSLCKVGIVDFGLESEVGAGGEQLSAGQRQLVVIARATLSPATVVLMDEPTASCDAQTDSKVQQLLHASFKGRTVLCIAHRLNTIMGYDKVLVMEAGEAVEHGCPNLLVTNPNSHFGEMCQRGGVAQTQQSKLTL